MGLTIFDKYRWTYSEVRTRIANHAGLASLRDDGRCLRHIHGFSRRHGCSCVCDQEQEQENFVEAVTQRTKGMALIIFNCTQELPLRMPLLPLNRHLIMTLWTQLALLFPRWPDVGQEPSPRYRGRSARTLGGVDRDCGVWFGIAGLFRTQAFPSRNLKN